MVIPTRTMDKILMIGFQWVHTFSFLEVLPFLGIPRNNLVLLGHPASQNTELLLIVHAKLFGFVGYLKNLEFWMTNPLTFFVIIKAV